MYPATSATSVYSSGRFNSMNMKLALGIVSIFLLACLATVTPPVETSTPPISSTLAITPETTVAPTQITIGPMLANCPMFLVNNFWNARVDTLPLNPQSDSWIKSIGASESFHMDFGSGEWDGGPIGIPFNIVAGSTDRDERPLRERRFLGATL